jgi:hypothetical protein
VEEEYLNFTTRSENLRSAFDTVVLYGDVSLAPDPSTILPSPSLYSVILVHDYLQKCFT